MCTGGGGVSKATITEPDKKQTRKVNSAVRFMAGKVNKLMRDDSPLNKAQSGLIDSTQQLNQALTLLNQTATMAANNQDLLQADAARLSALVGPPPPEESASAPLVGRARSDGPRSGSARRSLRIERSQPSQLSIY